MRRNMGRPRAARNGPHGNGNGTDPAAANAAATEQALMEMLRSQGIDLSQTNIPREVLAKVLADCGLDPALAAALLGASEAADEDAAEGGDEPADAGDAANDARDAVNAAMTAALGEGGMNAAAGPDVAAATATDADANAPDRMQEMRDKLGRFVAGNRGGPGNPFGRHVARNRQILLRVVTPETIEKILGKLVAMALEGHIAAAKLVLQYVIGKPTAAPNPDRVEHEEWELSQDEPSVMDVMQHQNLGYMTHRFANETRRAFEAGREQKLANVCHAGQMQMQAVRAKQAERAERRRLKKEARQRRKHSE